MPPKDDYDGPWKEALARFFPEALALFLPEAHAEIDWERGVEFLEQELRSLEPESQAPKGVVDVLARVVLRGGEAAEVYLHVEAQRAREGVFAERMHRYDYRLVDRFGSQEVVSLAVLGDDDPGWRPSVFEHRRWGRVRRLEFPAVKLLDYEEPTRRNELEESANPFAVVVLAHLATLRTRDDPERRLDSKVALLRGLIRRGFALESIRALLRLIDWLLRLSPEQQLRFEREVAMIEKETAMPFMTSWERRGYDTGHAKGHEAGLAEGRTKGLAEGRTKGLAEGRTKGLAEGRTKGLAEGHEAGLAEGRTKGLAEGRTKGLAEGRAEGLLHVLTARFGAEARALEPRLGELEAQELARLVQAALDAADLDEFRAALPGVS